MMPGRGRALALHAGTTACQRGTHSTPLASLGTHLRGIAAAVRGGIVFSLKDKLTLFPSCC